MSRLNAFIESEREQYATYDNNIFAVALSQVVRYHEFLSIISARYQLASDELRLSIQAFQDSLSPSGGTLSEAQLIHLREQSLIRARVHLDIEAFYVFAKILLDRVALVIERYFGSARGLRLLSHSRLAKSFCAYAGLKQLSVPSGLPARIALLEQRIGDYRDKQISHHHNLRTFHGTTFGPEGGMRILSSPLYPKADDRHENSEDLATLFRELDEYVDAIIAFVTDNRLRSALVLKQSTNDAKAG